MVGKRKTLSSVELLVAVQRIHAGKLKVPEDKRLEYLKAEIGKVDDLASREALETLVLSAEETLNTSFNEQTNKTESDRELRFFFVSIVFILLAIGLAFFSPTPSQTQVFSIQLSASLGAAGFAAYMPGMMVIEGYLPQSALIHKGKIRAAGAGAIFLLVWLYVPSLLKLSR